MQTLPNHYEILGVPPTASQAEIRACYVALARLHHPDFHVAEAMEYQVASGERMRDINQAWHVLGNRARRDAYDRSVGRPWLAEQGSTATSKSAATAPSPGSPAEHGAGASNRLVWIGLVVTLVLFGAGLITGSSALLIVGLACTVLAGVVTVVGPSLRARGDGSTHVVGREKTA